MRNIVMCLIILGHNPVHVSTFFDDLLSRGLGMAVDVNSWKIEESNKTINSYE